MWHPIKHYKTIRHHKMLVMKNCFRCGLYWQGLTHDLSKLAPVEFWAGAKYWQGTCSPNNAQRQAEGYSAAWLHHKGRNKLKTLVKGVDANAYMAISPVADLLHGSKEEETA